MIKADLIIQNGTIITLDNENEIKRSLASYKGRIIGIWNDKYVTQNRVELTENAKIIDLDGLTLMPGFIDTHNHLLMYAQNKEEVNCSYELNQSIKEIQENLGSKIKNNPDKKWVLGYGYDDTLIKEHRHPTKEDLDEVSTEHPIFIRHISNHLAVVNSKALEIAGVTRDILDPSGGYFGRDDKGELTGVLYEPEVMDVIFKKVPVPTKEKIAELIGKASNDYLAVGITTSTDAGVGLQLDKTEYDAHILAVSNGDNPLKMRFMMLNHLLLEGGAFANYTAEELDNEIRKETNNKACLDSAKLFQDGSIQGLTGALREPYYCDEKLRGDLIFSQETLNDYVKEFHDRGYRIATHGNGDRSIGSIIEAYQHAIENGEQRNHQHRIEHVQTATENDLKEMKASSIKASFFINHVYYWGDRHRDIFLGPYRANRLNPLKDAEDLDILFTLHSDCPITPISPMFSVWAAVNRLTRNGEVLGESQKIDVITALKSMTIYGAELNFEENKTGSIEIGKAADFVVLDKNPLEINPLELKEVEVQQTIINGKTVYIKSKGESSK